MNGRHPTKTVQTLQKKSNIPTGENTRVLSGSIVWPPALYGFQHAASLDHVNLGEKKVYAKSNFLLLARYVPNVAKEEYMLSLIHI